MSTQRATPRSKDGNSDDRVHRERGRLRREEILLEAANQFSRRGLDTVSVEDVAKAVGCNKSLVYYYFGSKDGLRDAVMKKLLDITQEIWSELRSQTFAHWVRDTTEWPRNHSNIPWLRLTAREGLSDTGRAVLEEERARALGESTRVVVRAQGSGEVDSELDPELVALLILFLTMGPVTIPQLVRMITGDSPDSVRFHERYSAFIDTLVQRLAPGSAT
ncbi:TetR/AcrR family transcriptional regulator [Streptomyces sp. UG1]|uniref:TetR/AcrR family transcriptional regulator n=1 Tax=Streptomyces sp. UG1 TaxID=3417652 RepID=UPI003CEADA06